MSAGIILSFDLVILIVISSIIHQSENVIHQSVNFLYENDPTYGKEWVYFLDDYGTTHVLNFSALPTDTRSMLFGDAYFHLYTRQNLDDFETLAPDESPLRSKFFNPAQKVKIVTHGWLSNDKANWLQNIKDAYLRKYDYNVITVDWNEISKNPLYPWPALSTRYVGKRIAKLVNTLSSSYGVKGEDVHLIGHSLGAHVMGYAGMFSDQRISRITGLDPARPMFELPRMSADYRLERSDADFVDIIHTSGGLLGYDDSQGHADFYPNAGKPAQPGCENSLIEGCSHGRSCEFFAESIDSEVGFVAYPCESWEQFERGECRSSPTMMGDPVSLDARGDYYLHTRNQSKYALGDEMNN